MNLMLMAETRKSNPGFANFLVAQSGNEGCWEWNGFRRGGREGQWYGGVQVSGHSWYAHRLSYAIFNGELVAGLEIDHLCRNRRCVNPAHLEQVEGTENWRRGKSITRAKQLQTHCKNGHEFTPENTYVHRRKGRNDARDCRQCVLLAQARAYATVPGKADRMKRIQNSRYANDVEYREAKKARSRAWGKRRRAERNGSV